MYTMINIAKKGIGMESHIQGKITTEKYDINNDLYVPDLTMNLFSAKSQGTKD